MTKKQQNQLLVQIEKIISNNFLNRELTDDEAYVLVATQRVIFNLLGLNEPEYKIGLDVDAILDYFGNDKGWEYINSWKDCEKEPEN